VFAIRLNPPMIVIPDLLTFIRSLILELCGGEMECRWRSFCE